MSIDIKQAIAGKPIDTSPAALRGLAHYWDGLLVDCPFVTQCGDGMADALRAVAAEKEAQGWQAENERLRHLLRDLHALVWGECPSLLDEDSGGDSKLALEIDAAIKGDD